nr:sulfatase-like hydrolase/transferase [Saprospiraceae bacterium]
QGFDTIISDQNFPSSDDITEWGVPDHIMLKKAIEVLDNQKQIFFSTILLMSSHSPFDVPWQNEFKDSDIATKYKSSVRYSDQSLKQFFQESASKPWFANTIFIITSDHGSTHSGWAGMEDHNRFRIPFIIFDPSKPWSESGQENTTYNNHFDIASTVLSGMGLSSEKFIFSRNIMSGSANYRAYWNIDIASGCYGKDHQEIINLNKVQNPKSKSVLFLDAVKLYFNQL